MVSRGGVMGRVGKIRSQGGGSGLRWGRVVNGLYGCGYVEVVGIAVPTRR